VTIRFRALLCAAAFLFSPALADDDEPHFKRPGDGGGPDRVKYCVFVIDIDDIDSAEQNFTANFFVSMEWNDPRAAHEGESEIMRRATRVWMPPVLVVNQQKLWPTFAEVVSIEPDGTVYYEQRYWGQLSQPLRLHDFPFDTHEFVIQFATPRYVETEIEFVQDPANPSGIAKDLSIADYRIIDSAGLAMGYVPLETDDPRAGFQFKFTAERESGYYLIKVIVPLLLIIAMSWVVFWIDPTESGTQIGVATTTMLTLIAYRFAMGGDLPKISYLTRMDFFILLSTVLVFLSLLEVVITSYLAKIGRLNIARRIDRVARLCIPGIFIILTLLAFLG
jgi:hypothetical protein